jgi:hypothetical protein
MTQPLVVAKRDPLFLIGDGDFSGLGRVPPTTWEVYWFFSHRSGAYGPFPSQSAVLSAYARACRETALSDRLQSRRMSPEPSD